jgi:acetylornithine deacetylase/succinyl-diaminopimelate desuccinylase-like protein
VVIRALNQCRVSTVRPIEVAVRTNEEGSRFPPAMLSSGVFAGVFDLDYGLSRTDSDAKTIGEELRRIGYNGNTAVGGRPIHSFFEAHIEQGPILGARNKTIGRVEGVQGIRWYEVVVTGQEAHAGPTPMLLEQAGFFLQILDHLKLMAVDPTGKSKTSNEEARAVARWQPDISAPLHAASFSSGEVHKMRRLIIWTKRDRYLA